MKSKLKNLQLELRINMVTYVSTASTWKEAAFEAVVTSRIMRYALHGDG